MRSFARVFTLLAFALLSSACARIVSTDPLLDGMTPSATNWSGTYLASDASSKKQGILLLQRLDDRVYEFSLFAASEGPVLSTQRVLYRFGEGLVHFADIRDGLVVSEARCSVRLQANVDAKVVANVKATVDTAKQQLHPTSKTDLRNFPGPNVYLIWKRQPSGNVEVLHSYSSTYTDEVREMAAKRNLGAKQVDLPNGVNAIVRDGHILQRGELLIAGSNSPADRAEFFSDLARTFLTPADSPHVLQLTPLSPHQIEKLELHKAVGPPNTTDGICGLEMHFGK